jgi:hypothetical protein
VLPSEVPAALDVRRKVVQDRHKVRAEDANPRVLEHRWATADHSATASKAAVSSALGKFPAQPIADLFAPVLDLLHEGFECKRALARSRDLGCVPHVVFDRGRRLDLLTEYYCELPHSAIGGDAVVDQVDRAGKRQDYESRDAEAPSFATDGGPIQSVALTPRIAPSSNRTSGSSWITKWRIFVSPSA